MSEKRNSLQSLALKCLGACAISLLATTSPAAGDLPLGTAFTYQGELQEGGVPVDEPVDGCGFEFSLWDDPIDAAPAAQVGLTLMQTELVVGGRFTATLDFGANIFTGQARWLEIAVCCPAPCGSPTTLSPRQELTPAPHALALPGLYTQQNASSPNLIGGYLGNTVEPGAVGVTIGGGGQSGSVNRAFDDFGTIGGGDLNVVGFDDMDPSLTPYATVVGGRGNTASGIRSTVVGGASNLASGPDATVAGGRDNQATGSFSVVAAGNLNLASGARSTIGGGNNNTASGQRTTVSGGSTNTASGSRATVPGGQRNTAAGDFSLAAGQQAQANHAGSFVWSDTTTVDPDFFASTEQNQFLVMAAGGMGVGTNSPSEMLTVAGTIESTFGGIRFPDGTLQTTADTGDTDTDTLGDLSCADGEVAKWNSGLAQWECAPDDSAAGGGNTLDAAYDEGGAGAGRIITADRGAVEVAGAGGLDVTGDIHTDGTLSSGSSITIDGTAIDGTINSTGDLDLQTSGTSRVFIDDSNGNVGIGTVSPVNKLDVAGGVAIGAAYAGTNSAPSNSLIVEGRIAIGTSTTNVSSDLKIVHEGNPGVVRVETYNADSFSGSILHLLDARGTEASPSASVSGDIFGEIGFGGYNGSASGTFAARILAKATENWSTGVEGTKLSFYTTPNGAGFATERLTIDHNGRVGIGTTLPVEKLSVAGNIHVTGTVDGVDIAAHAANADAHHVVPTSLPPSGSAGGDLSGTYPNPAVLDDSHNHGDSTVSDSISIDNGRLYAPTGSGNVGIGISSPLAPLHVIQKTFHSDGGVRVSIHGTSSNPSFVAVRSRNTFVSPTAVFNGDTLGSLNLGGYDGSSYGLSAQISAVAQENWAVGEHGTNLEFYTTPNNSPTSLLRMAIANNGNVGIGTGAPNSTLHIDGDSSQPALRVRVNGFTKLLVAPNGGTTLGINNVNPPAGGLFVAGNVGIGTNTPGSHSLSVVGSSTGVTGATLSVENTNAGSGIAANFRSDGTDTTIIIGNDGSGDLIRAFSSFQPCCPLFQVTNSGRLGMGRGTGPGHPLHVGTDSSNGNGAHLTNGGDWVSTSDRATKTGFKKIDVRQVLSKLAVLPLSQWRYKGDAESIKHIGPVAQDFYEGFGLGDSDRHIGMLDASGVAFAAIQGLHEIVQEKDCEIAEQGAHIAEQEMHISDLEARLSRIEAMMVLLNAVSQGGAR